MIQDRGLKTALQTAPAVDRNRISPVLQLAIHVVSIYFIGWLCLPALGEFAFEGLTRFIPRNALQGNPLQFTFSHLLSLSILLGLTAGFANTRLVSHKIVYIACLIPAIVLCFVFVFYGPGVYPTMLTESDFGKAFHFYFGADYRIVGEYRSYKDFHTLIFNNLKDILRGYEQLRVTIPAYVGVAYTVGAWLTKSKSQVGMTNKPSAKLTM